MATARLPKPFTPDELHKLFAEAVPLEAAALTFLLETGMRSAEARSITKKQAESWPSPGRWRRQDHVISVVGKGGKERIVLLTNEALRAAKVLARGSENGHMIPWSERGLRWKFEELGKRTGIHCHVHRTRHTAISEWVEAGTPIEVVADMAGHSSVDITRLYFASSIRLRREAVRRRRRARR